MTQMRLPPKKDVALALLERSTIFLHLDPRDEGVRVPPWFKKQAQLVLQVGLNMAVPIRDLEVDDEAISCTLSFSRTPHFCFMPFSAIYALVGEDGRGMVWPDDVPPEVAAQASTGGTPQQAPRKRSRLRAVGDDEQAQEESAEPADAVDAEPALAAAESSAESQMGEESPADAAPKRAGLRSVAPAAAESEGPAAEADAPLPGAAPAQQAEQSSAAPGAVALRSRDGQVPAPEPPSAAQGGEPPSDRDEDAAAGSEKSDPAEPPAELDNGKRKLPPYLRIVKQSSRLRRRSRRRWCRPSQRRPSSLRRPRPPPCRPLQRRLSSPRPSRRHRLQSPRSRRRLWRHHRSPSHLWRHRRLPSHRLPSRQLPSHRCSRQQPLRSWCLQRWSPPSLRSCRLRRRRQRWSPLHFRRQPRCRPNR